MVERLKMKGIGSQRFFITSASEEIAEMVGDDYNLRHCNIELRVDGIILHFRSRARSIAWAIPYWQLNLTLQAGRLTVFAGNNKMQLRDAHDEGISRTFVARLYEMQAKSTGQDHDIYGSHP